jgi:hypothetical protein
MSQLWDIRTAGKNVSTEAEDIAEIRHQATTADDTEDSEGLVRAVVNCPVTLLLISTAGLLYNLH